jgi:hypothetical protein
VLPANRCHLRPQIIFYADAEGLQILQLAMNVV